MYVVWEASRWIPRLSQQSHGAARNLKDKKTIKENPLWGKGFEETSG